ncbi:hypothetical protein N9921_01530 [Akkermansiaceae bacterium]|nr:hypothetical protein [Akkermansiaceae bacterium]
MNTVEDRKSDERLSRLHALNVTIILVDETDDTRLKSVGHSSSQTQFYSLSREREMLKPEISFSDSDGVTTIFCKGVIDPPFDITLTSDGYEPQVLRLTENDSGVIRVPMKKQE